MARRKSTGTTPAESSNGHQTIARLADEVLPTLIARLGASGLGELEVRQDGWRVRLRREMGPAPTDHARHKPRSGNPGHADNPGEDRGVRRERGRLAIDSPAVGYYQPRDGLAVGMSVRGGDVLGQVEVLGVRHEVVAPEDGIMAAVLAEAGQAVEYGQPLARLEPEGRG